MRYYETVPGLRAVLDAIGGDMFSPDEPGRYRTLVHSLMWGGDHYMLLADYGAYVATQARVDALYRTPDAWFARAIANVAGMGPFSADRTIRAYASDIWHVDPAPAAPA
jgi:starch phosphorylase